MKREVAGVALVGVLAWGWAQWGPAGDCSKPGLDQEMDFSDSGVNYTIFYRTDAGSTHRISHADATNLQANAISSYDALVGTMNFRTPYLNTLPQYDIIVKDDWYYAEPGCLVMHAPGVRSDPESDTRCIFFHERFHTVQRHYKCGVGDCDSGYIGSTFGKWVSEGTADAIMDKGYLDLDNLTGYPYYENSARNYLNDPDTTLFDREYNACLWWNYLMEQMGVVRVEPQVGTDFLQAFWDRVASNGASGSAACRTAMEQTISSFSSRSFENVFLDFSICNYTRAYDASAVPNASYYSYVDEQGQAILTSVPVTAIGALPASQDNVGVPSFAARYFEHVLDGGGDCEVVGFKADDADDVMGFAAVAVDNSGRVIGIRKGIGQEFAATFFNPPSRPIRRLVGIAVGLEETTPFDYAFDRGSVKLEIVRPTFSHPAYPGPHDEPGNVVVRTRVLGPSALEPEGPGTLSVLGLQASDFTVLIGGSNAPVSYADYVGGEYQLLVEAPEQPADGLYDLAVQLCTADQSGVTATSRQSVYYGDIRFHHVVALDISGSMEYPTSAKLDAAKEAAKFYIDAVTDNDRLTVVTFSGDTTECNEDAANLKGSSGLVLANGLSRGLLKMAVDAQSSKNMTSIGDGLWTAQDALDAEAAAVSYEHFDAILLLSDGKENEARYWDSTTCIASGTVASRLTASDTMINSLAFGADADHSLMQTIGLVTEGDYSYIPVDESTGSLMLKDAAAASIGIGTMQNDLTLRFLEGIERAKGLQRLVMATADVAAGGRRDLLLDLREEVVQGAILFVGWSAPGTVQVRIQDPSGVDPETYALAVYSGDSHHILHLKGLKSGVYEVRLNNLSGQALECFAGISGIPGNGLRVEFTLAPFRTGGVAGRSESAQELFEQGVPVRMLARIYDRKGAVRDAKVEVQVTLPDGETACRSLHLFDDGRHVDQRADDGLYGLLYTRTPLAGRPGGNTDENPKIPDDPKQSGNYHVSLLVRGKANDGSEFLRSLGRDFQVYERVEQADRDHDGMPDTWEVYYGTDPAKPDDSLDPDRDGLTNKDEFYHGTHPRDPDTDNGGESDGSEVKNSRCPLDPTDDLLPPVSEVSIITSPDSRGGMGYLRPNALLLHFPDHASYQEMEIFRSTSPALTSQPSNRVATLDLRGKNINSYYDEGLADGTRYYYRLRALGLSGSATPFSRVITAVAKADPYVPGGHILINQGARYTDRLNVRVDLIADSLVKEYRLSQQPFTGAEPYLAIVPRTNFVFSGLSSGDVGIIYVQFRSASGNESDVTDDTILYRTTGDADRDGTVDGVDTDDDNDGLLDATEIFQHGTNPFTQDTDRDGWRDPVEIQAGSDPLDPMSVPSGDGDADGYPNDLEQRYGADASDALDYPDLRFAIQHGAGAVEVLLPTRVGVAYQLQYAEALAGPSTAWMNLGAAIPGTGGVVTVPLTPDQSARYLQFNVVVD
ncbi:MAG TPA: VWA domain-containing protein [Candidatus Paceibacterota bacterium]|nr:VWA domain-containing protein [Verrucomicrobiota bacterium]HRZ47418.1 VWA domain-containing protein [Candidatus Paceibacterota bacterium]